LGGSIEGVNVVEVAVNKAVLKLDTQIYPLTTVHAAAYVFVDRAYFLMDKNSDGSLQVTIVSKGEDPEKLKLEFYNELLNYNNYFTHLDKNKDVVRMIVERALFSANPSLVEEAEKQEIQNLLKELEQEDDPEIKEIVKELKEEQDPNFIPVDKVGKNDSSQPQ